MIIESLEPLPKIRKSAEKALKTLVIKYKICYYYFVYLWVGATMPILRNIYGKGVGTYGNTAYNGQSVKM